MVSYRESPVDKDAALALLTEYFSFRRESFPSTMGEYRATFPTPADFVLPHGVFLIVEGEGLDGDAADVGCGGIRQIEAGAAGLVRFEVKHVWIRPFARGGGLGRALLAELERRARDLGAEELVLDTNDTLEAAGSLYRSAGFTAIPPYNDNPNATTWYAKALNYQGMSMNERLDTAGLIDEWDAAIEARDRVAAIQLLERVEFSERAAWLVDIALANPTEGPLPRPSTLRALAASARLGGAHNYAGMTVNERLASAGLLDEWDVAINARDRTTAIDVLRRVEIDDGAPTVDAIFANPEKYGYRS